MFRVHKMMALLLFVCLLNIGIRILCAHSLITKNEYFSFPHPPLRHYLLPPIFFVFLLAIFSSSKVFTRLDGGATYVDSDTGLESMSSAEATTKACSLCLDGVVAPNNMMPSAEVAVQMDGLKQEVTRLKCDKLDLLRQNVVS